MNRLKTIEKGVEKYLKESEGGEFRLEYVNKAGDIITRDYIIGKDAALKKMKSLCDTYRTFGTENAYLLALVDEDDTYVAVAKDPTWELDVEEGLEEDDTGDDVSTAEPYIFSEFKEYGQSPDYEEFNDYTMEISKRDFNKAVRNVQKIYDNIKDHIYSAEGTELIELHDHHTVYQLKDNGKSDRDWHNIVVAAIESFEENTGVELFTEGRMGRHMCVEYTFENAKRYDELVRVCEELEQYAIDEFNDENGDGGQEDRENINESLSEDLPNVKCVVVYYDSDNENRMGSEWTIYSHYTPANTRKLIQKGDFGRPAEAKSYVILSTSQYDDAYKHGSKKDLNSYSSEATVLERAKLKEYDSNAFVLYIDTQEGPAYIGQKGQTLNPDEALKYNNEDQAKKAFENYAKSIQNGANVLKIGRVGEVSLKEDDSKTEDILAKHGLADGDDRFHYGMLSRMQSDCDYFLGNGNRNEKHLWCKDPKEHIAVMRALYNIVPEKPDWISKEDIDNYEKEMCECNLKEEALDDNTEEEIKDILEEVSKLEKMLDGISDDVIYLDNRIEDLNKKTDLNIPSIEFTRLTTVTKDTRKELEYALKDSKWSKEEVEESEDVQDMSDSELRKLAKKEIRTGKLTARTIAKALDMEEGILPGVVSGILSSEDIDSKGKYPRIKGSGLAKIVDHLDSEELRSLCFDLGIRPGLDESTEWDPDGIVEKAVDNINKDLGLNLVVEYEQMLYNEVWHIFDNDKTPDAYKPVDEAVITITDEMITTEENVEAIIRKALKHF